MSDEAGLTPVQQVQALWADGRQHVYAVILGSRVRGLRERLASAEVDDWDVLWTGELDASELDAAPCLVALIQTSDFTQWLVAEAAKAYGEWGLLLRSRRPFLELRSHARSLCQARLPDGSELRLDWADPAILQILLPLAPVDQLASVFSAVESIIVAGTGQWTHLSSSVAGLQVQRNAVLPAG